MCHEMKYLWCGSSDTCQVGVLKSFYVWLPLHTMIIVVCLFGPKILWIHDLLGPKSFGPFIWTLHIFGHLNASYQKLFLTQNFVGSKMHCITKAKLFRRPNNLIMSIHRIILNQNFLHFKVQKPAPQIVLSRVRLL